MIVLARSSGGAVRAWWAAFAIAASGLAPSSADAEDLNPPKQDRPIVSVTLIPGRPNGPTVALKIPVNYLDPSNSGNCVGSRGEKRLHIEDKVLNLAIANPGGQGGCSDRWRDWSPRDTSQDGLRKQISLVTLNVNANPNWNEGEALRFIHARRQKEKWYDLLYFKDNTNDYFLGDPSDHFNSVSCAARWQPIFYCDYTIKLSDALVARARFVDFRSHGGRAFANERSRLIRDTVCRFTACEPVAKPGAYRGDQKQRLCLDSEVPSVEAKIGFSRYFKRNVPGEKTDADWVERTYPMFWRVKVPASTFLQPSRDRSDVTGSFYLSMVYPQAVLNEPIRNTIHWKLGANLPWEDPPNETCSKFIEISAEEIYDRNILLNFLLPTHPGGSLRRKTADGCLEDRPDRAVTRLQNLDFSDFKACHYSSSIMGFAYDERLLFVGPDDSFPILSCGLDREGTGGCGMMLKRDGWPVRVGFRSDKKTEWQAIKASVFAFLDSITISRDDITKLVEP